MVPAIVVEKIKIVVVDDQPIVRSGIVKVLTDEPDIVVLAEVAGYPDLLAYLRASELKGIHPDLVLMDLSKSETGGFEALNELKKFYPNVKVLMLSMSPEGLFVVRAMRAGAAGYLTRESAIDELVVAIHEVYKRGRYITPTVAKRLIDSMDINGGRPEHEKLSNRELQVLSLIARGKRMKEIAELLSLSPATVGTYRARILEKMQMKSNVELANYAVRNNLLQEGLS